MSRVTFTTKNQGSAELLGSERAWASCFCMDLVRGQIRGFNVADFVKMFPAGHYLHSIRQDPYRLSEAVRTAIAAGDDTLTLPDGRTTTGFLASLNTAIVVGNDVVRLMARLHGQCEVHGWVAGKNRKWLSDIIADGCRVGLLREEEGWEAVVDLLRLSDEGDVVTSYSVCDSFPNPSLAGIEYDEEADNEPWEEFSSLSADERWDRSFASIKSVGSLEWRPDDWASIRFGQGVTVLDMLTARWPDAKEALRA